jgi:hypothetical protein
MRKINCSEFDPRAIEMVIYTFIESTGLGKCDKFYFTFKFEV